MDVLGVMFILPSHFAYPVVASSFLVLLFPLLKLQNNLRCL